jgi:hypothetical protein
MKLYLLISQPPFWINFYFIIRIYIFYFLVYHILYNFCKPPNFPFFVTKKQLRAGEMLEWLVDIVDHPKQF